MTRLDRRSFLGWTAAGLAAPFVIRAAGAAPPQALRLGEPEPFSYDGLVAYARDMAARPYTPPYRPAPEIVDAIDYDAHGKIRFRADLALYADGPGAYPATFFHLGRYFPKAVRMHVVENGTARAILYEPDYFDMPADSIARKLPPGSGFAGFRLQESRRRKDWRTQDWVAFLGASYFRAFGALGQYGMSARGIAVDTTASVPEEFPDFVAFYIEGAPDEDQPTMVHALLDGPSLSGAYRFALRRTDGVVIDVEAALFLRADIEQLGFAPLTSMFWYGEYDRPRMMDWRPEVHDSDGLAMWTGAGERIWRPLNNPARVVTSSFLDSNPRGFGLLQRDRNFDHYLDGVYYDRRPSVWVEPLGGWKDGAVQLVEIPTDDEIHDNIVAFWVAREPARAGTARRLRYRLHWLADEPYPASNVARTVATRIGRGGQPGRPRPKGVEKFCVEFAGGPLDLLRDGEQPLAVVTASRGEISRVFTEPVPNTARWRAFFDLAAPGVDPVELRLFLRLGDRPLSETWLYQFTPPAVA
ncbi:MAG: glucan biosynthesis protein D [Rhodospirillaceae bacterium]|nr:glucan biosynthesis protein D [Rhodospirillaceae bacterium]